MFKDTQFIQCSGNSSLEEVIKEYIVKGRRTLYVVDENNKFIGCFDEKELMVSKTLQKLYFNCNAKYVNEGGEEDKIRSIFLAYKGIKEIPVLDVERRILYCYRKDENEEMEILIKHLKEQGVSIGEDVHIYNSFIDRRWGWLISIGNHVTISCATILGHDASMRKELGRTKLGKVVIGDNCFIGYGSIILPNVQIGNKVIVGAGTVVAKNIPDNSVAIGNPMRIIGTYDDYIEKQEKNMEDALILSDDRKMTLEDKRRIADKMGTVAYI